MSYEQIVLEHKRLEEQIELLQEQLIALPAGTVVHKTCGKYINWYIKENAQMTYLKKDQQVLKEKLILKKYYLQLLEDLMYEKDALSLYIGHYSKHTPKAQLMLHQDSCYQKFLHAQFKSYSEDLSEWANAPFEQNKNHPENLIHKSISNQLLRSKSEVLIDLSLYQNKIPYRYECALYLEGICIFPDFTIRHPRTGEIYYWEHFGMMEDPMYSNEVYKKLKFYNQHGLIPMINLITTYETKNSPLTIDTVEKIIHHYFL